LDAQNDPKTPAFAANIVKFLRGPGGAPLHFILPYLTLLRPTSLHISPHHNLDSGHVKHKRNSSEKKLWIIAVPEFQFFTTTHCGSNRSR
jgi:hypothetical protein